MAEKAAADAKKKQVEADREAKYRERERKKKAREAKLEKLRKLELLMMKKHAAKEQMRDRDEEKADNARAKKERLERNEVKLGRESSIANQPGCEL